MFPMFRKYLIRTVDESPLQVFSLALGFTAMLMPFTILPLRRWCGLKTNQWDKCALESRLDRWLRLKQESAGN